MKKPLFFAFFTIIMLGLPCLVSAQTPQEQPSTDDLSTAITRAEEARKKAGDFESPSYFPGEWDAAETRYAHANSEKTAAAYHAAEDAFESVFKLAIPLYAQAREDEIMALRNSLVAAGARASFPEIFAFADTTALLAQDQYQAQDYYTARDSAAKAFAMYQAMTSAHNAWLAQREIKDKEFDRHDAENFERAGKILDDAMALYQAEKYALAQENANEALSRYNLILSTGWAAYAEKRFSMAETKRQEALDNKANIAARELFDEADSIYKTSVVSYDSQKYEEAAHQFINAETLFIEASASTSEKRDKAAEIIKRAQEKVAQSDETARQAEILIQGRSK